MASVLTKVEFIPTGRGGRKLAHGGYTYRVNRKSGTKIWWLCSARGCQARVSTDNDILQALATVHCHPPSIANIQVEKVMSMMRKRARDEIKPMPSIYVEEIAKLRSGDTLEASEDVARNMPSFQSLKTGLYKQRQKMIPRIPKSREDIELDGPWTKTRAGEDFILANDGTLDRIILFGTDSNLRHLCNAEKIFCDGTFYSSPQQFLQIYTLHANVEGQMFPLIYGLLPNKSKTTYSRMFRLLRHAATVRGLSLNPNCLQLDYEKAVHRAACEVFPDVSIKGCFFHYTQCIWRKVQNLGLATIYQSDPDLYKFVRRAAVLPLVPQTLIDDVWLEAMAHSPDTESARLFADYMVETWLEGLFSRTSWNHFDTDGHRTTNHLEGWHHKLNRLTMKAHPNVFELIAVLQTEQAANEVKILQLEGGSAPVAKRRKYRNIDQRLTTLKDRFLRGDITVLKYADSASHLLAI